MSLYNRISADIVVEPFGGSAKFLLNINNWTLDGVKTVVYNDADKRVANLFRQVKDNPQELAEKFRWVINSRDWFNDFNKHESIDPIEDAFRTLYVLALGQPQRNFNSFGWHVDDPDRLDSVMSRIYQIHKIVRKWIIECADFATIINRYNFPNTFFYLDPPYTAMKGGMYRINEINYHKLKHLLDGIKGYYVMNINDSRLVRDIFGEPQVVKEFKNMTNGSPHADVRIELFYHNLPSS